MKKIDHLKHIDTDTPEGRLLVSAISKIQRLTHGKTFAEVLKNLNELTDKIYPNEHYTATNNTQRDPRPFLEATVCRTNETREGRNTDLAD